MMGGGGLAAGPSKHPAPTAGTRPPPQANPFHPSSAPISSQPKHTPTPPHNPPPPTANHGDRTYSAEEVWLTGRERLRPIAKACAVRVNDKQCDAELVTDLLHAKKHLDKIEADVTKDPHAPLPQVWIASQRIKWDNFQELRHAFDVHAFRNCLCAVKKCPNPHLLRPDSHYKNNHPPADYRDDLLRPKLELNPGVPPELPPLPGALPPYLITTHEIRPFTDRPLPAIPTPGPRLRELREDIVEVRDEDDVPFLRPGALWDSSDFATQELEDDDEGTVIGQVEGAPVIRLSAPPPTPLQGGRMRKRASSVMSDASWAPSVAPSSPVAARMGTPRVPGVIREGTPLSTRGDTPLPSTPKRGLRQTPSLEASQPIFVPPPGRRRAKPVFAKNNKVLLTTVPLPDGHLPPASASAKGARPMRVVKAVGRPREIPQPLDYILARREAAHRAATAPDVKPELPATQGSLPPSQTPTQVGSQPSSQPMTPGSSQMTATPGTQLSQASQMLPPSQPRRGVRGKRKAPPGRDDDEVVERAAEDWAFVKTGRYCGISFWEHKMAFERAVEAKRAQEIAALFLNPPV